MGMADIAVARQPAETGPCPVSMVSDLEVLAAEHPDRASLERFIAETYQRVHGARIRHFAQHLAGLKRDGRNWSAGAGYTLAADVPLFIEQYLDRPVESELSARLEIPVRRDQIVEVGNLAILGREEGCSARALIVGMGRLLQVIGRPWVVFTSTQALRNSFTRLGVTPLVLGAADPARLPDGAASWGSYYDNHPQVMAANIPLGLALVAPREVGSA